MHPSTKIQYLSDLVGCGVVAREFIPKGTLIWVRDPLDRILDAGEVRALPELAREYSLTYMYRNYLGQYVLLWDHGKYVNHSFHPNCMPTPYGCDIVIRDIAPGEELTEDYGLLNIIQDFSPQPESGPANRDVVRGDDLVRHAAQWDQELNEALREITKVSQPLWTLLSSASAQELEGVSMGIHAPRSVAEMRFI